jgi:hypothetical protein
MSRIATALVIAGALVGLSAGPASAGTPIGPNQYFAGLVNGRHSHATVTMICPGPARTGHPRANQPLEVLLTPTQVGGFTGSAATSIVASFAPSSVSQQTVTFKEYGVKQNIPTSFILPCGGTGPLIFSPQPFDHGRADVITVTFVNIGA